MKAKNCRGLFGMAPFFAVSLLLVWPATARSQTVVATIPVAGSPDAVAVNTVTDKIYVASYLAKGVVTVIDGASNSTTTIAVGVRPISVAVNEATNKIYVANAGDESLLFGGSDPGGVTVIDGATNSVTTVTDPNAVGPRMVAVNSVTNTIYVVNLLSADVTVIDGATNAITTVADPNAAENGLAPVALAVNSATNKIYVANGSCLALNGCTNPGNITVIDGATNSTTTISDPNAISPVSVAVNPTTNKIYIANMGNSPATSNKGNVTVIDGATNAVTTVTDPNALAPGGPDSRGFSAAVNSTTNKIYVTNEGSRNVTVIDGATNSTLTLGDPNAVAPLGVVVDSATNVVYVVNGGCFFSVDCSNPGSLTVFGGATNSITTVIDPQANVPNAVAINATTNKVYVANLSSNNVTVIDGSAAATVHALSLLVGGVGSGTVTSTPSGIDCTVSCSATFPAGSEVSLSAAAASGSVFEGWDTGCAGLGTCNVTMNSDEFITATFNLAGPADFSVTPASLSLSIPAGGQMTDVITIAPLNGSFTNAIQLSCAVTGSTPLAICALSPSSVTPGANPGTSTLTVTAPAQSARLLLFDDGQLPSPRYAVFLPIPLALIGLGLANGKSRNRTRRLCLLCSLFIVFVALQAGCGGGNSDQLRPPPLNYTVTVTATSGAIQHSTQVTVTVQ